MTEPTASYASILQAYDTKIKDPSALTEWKREAAKVTMTSKATQWTATQCARIIRPIGTLALYGIVAVTAERFILQPALTKWKIPPVSAQLKIPVGTLLVGALFFLTRDKRSPLDLDHRRDGLAAVNMLRQATSFTEQMKYLNSYWFAEWKGWKLQVGSLSYQHAVTYRLFDSCKTTYREFSTPQNTRHSENLSIGRLEAGTQEEIYFKIQTLGEAYTQGCQLKNKDRAEEFQDFEKKINEAYTVILTPPSKSN